MLNWKRFNSKFSFASFLLKHKNYNVAVVTRSLEETNSWYSNFISNADVIVSATGIPEFLDSYKFYGKLIISPTIVKNKRTNFAPMFPLF